VVEPSGDQTGVLPIAVTVGGRVVWSGASVGGGSVSDPPFVGERIELTYVFEGTTPGAPGEDTSRSLTRFEGGLLGLSLRLPDLGLTVDGEPSGDLHLAGPVQPPPEPAIATPCLPGRCPGVPTTDWLIMSLPVSGGPSLIDGLSYTALTVQFVGIAGFSENQPTIPTDSFEFGQMGIWLGSPLLPQDALALLVPEPMPGALLLAAGVSGLRRLRPSWRRE